MEIQSVEMMSMAGQSRTQEQQKLGAELIIKTIEKMNEDQDYTIKSDYDFQKTVLTAATGKGSIINIIA